MSHGLREFLSKNKVETNSNGLQGILGRSINDLQVVFQQSIRDIFYSNIILSPGYKSEQLTRTLKSSIFSKISSSKCQILVLLPFSFLLLYQMYLHPIT